MSPKEHPAWSSYKSTAKNKHNQQIIRKMSLTNLSRFFKQNDLFSFNLKFLFLIGLWPANLTGTQRAIYTVYEIILSVLSFMFIMVTGIGTYRCRSNMTLFLANLDKSIVSYNYFLKMITFVINRDKLKSLIDDIERSGDYISEYRKLLMARHVVFVTALPLTVVTAFTGFALYEGVMPVEAWMPFDPLENRTNLLLACELVALLIVPCFCRGTAMQGIVCSLIMYLCDQLKSLQNDVRDLKYSKDCDIEMRSMFKKIVKKHIRLIGYTKSMESIFKEYFLIQNLAISMEICLTAVMVAQIGMTQMTLLITFIVYLLGALLNAYIYCYLGNEFIIQSQVFSAAAYESAWPSWPLDMQKNLLILITASQKPLKLTAGGMAWISIETFGQALYNGYSVFAVLNDVIN